MASTSSTAVPHYDHIVIVAEENHGYNTIVGSSSAPYINNTLIKGGALLTNDFDNGHPSLPNYLAMYGGSTFGVTDDNTHHEPDPSLYTVLHGAGDSFTGYVDNQGGLTDYDHNPWESFPEGTSVETDWNSGTATFSQLLGNNFANLPAVSFITPNLNHDMHNGTISEGDTWLQNNLGAYATWAQTHNSLLITTWDESETGDHIATILDGAHVAPGTTDATKYSHYNLLSTVLASEGLAAQAPRNAAGAATYNVFSGTSSGGGTLAASAALSSATEDQALAASTAVATFTDTNTSDPASGFTATVNWGDGSSSAGTIVGSNGTFSVDAGHTYGDEGNNPLSVAITRSSDGANVTASGTVAVAEADKLTAAGTTISGSSGSPVTGTVATFTDVNTGQVLGDFNASINWGDGSTSAGTITGSNGTFSVSGSHTFASPGTDAVSVNITDPGGTAAATASSTATISQGGTTGGTLAGSTTLSTATEYKALGSGTAIAGFTDTNTGDVASNFTAAINWGGGTATSAGTISGGNGSFTVSANHTYHDEGSKPLSVAVTRTTDNTSVNLTGTVAVAEADQFSAAGTSFSGTAGTALTATVANFTDVNAGQVAGDMAAIIGWGDGSTSAGTITGSNGTFQVAGTHTYASSGTDAVSVNITDPGGTAAATANGTAAISQGGTTGGTTTPQTPLHYAPNGSVSGAEADGFNLNDVSSVSAANALPAGDQGLVWWGNTTGVTTAFQSLVAQVEASPKSHGIYIADEPDNSASTIANIKAEVQYINAHAPDKMAFIVANNFGTPTSPSLGGYTPSATGMTASNDLIGLDPYPVRPVFSGGINLSVIDDGVNAAKAAGWSVSQMVPVYQAFGGGGSSGWTLPTGPQEQQIMQEFDKAGIVSPEFDYGYTWGLQTGLTDAISTSSALQSVFAAHNSGQF